MNKNIKKSSYNQKTHVQQFHNRITNQLTFHLKHYQQLHKKQKQLQHSTQPNIQQYLTSTTISHFLYDILELQNSSISFIMKQIFQSNKKSLWHIQQVLRIILDIQFVITVNNYIVAKQQQNLLSKEKINDEEIKFMKIDFKELVDVLMENCFFIKRPQNVITVELIYKIVQEINVQNGNKGHILLLQYKNFIFKNLIERHNQKKFLTPKKIKTLTPNNNQNKKQKYQNNSSSIKQVDQQSQAMGRTKNVFSSSEFQMQNMKLQQQSKITLQNPHSSSNDTSKQQNHILSKQQSNRNIEQKIRQLQGSNNDINSNSNYSSTRKVIIDENQYDSIKEFKQQQVISEADFQRILWESINQQIQKCKSIVIDDKEQFDKINKYNSLQSAIKLVCTKSRSQIEAKIITNKLLKTINPNEKQNQSVIISTMIRILGQQAFKKFHDNKVKNSIIMLSSNNTEQKRCQKPRFYLQDYEFKQILIQAYGNLIQGRNNSVNANSQDKNNKYQIFDQLNRYIFNSNRNRVSFKEFLILIQKISSTL